MNPESYLKLLGKWAGFALHDVHRIPGRPDMASYGPGCDNWGVQTNQKAFAAFAVLGGMTKPEAVVSGLSREEILETALQLLKFSLESHIEGSYKCLDGAKWGHTWISGLGIERMMHGLEAIRPFIPLYELELLKKVLISESDWLLDHYDVVGDPDGRSGKNKPESNLWNGALLHRTASLYPDTKRAGEYREKGFRFLVNSISIPSDASSELLLDGKTVKERFVGANFFESLALDHHGYLNVGYMSICLSNAAMLHFSCKHLGLRPPETLYHHVKELWLLLKQLCFPDGRLLRIGGDTRIRYCYCQDYLIPSCLLAADLLGDSDAPLLEKNWLMKVEMEQNSNADGSFLSDRCARFREKSLLYYTRLESDRAGTLSMGAYWRSLFPIVSSSAEKPDYAARPFAWKEPFHGALLHRNEHRIASWTWRAAELPCGIFVHPGASDMAEWRCNLAGETRGLGIRNWNEVRQHRDESFPGGFMTCGSFVSRSGDFLAEGVPDQSLVLHHVAFAALPDSHTGIVLQRAKTLVYCNLESVRGLNLLVPNDLFNFNKRRLRTEDGKLKTITRKDKGKDLLWDSASRSLSIDGKLGVRLIYGADSLCVHMPAERQIGLRMRPQAGGMLNAIEICSTYAAGNLEFDEGCVLFDFGCALFSSVKLPKRLSADVSVLDTPPQSGVRAVLIRGDDGFKYFFAVNFGDADTDADFLLPSPLSRVEILGAGDYSRGGDSRISVRLPCSGSILLKLA